MPKPAEIRPEFCCVLWALPAFLISIEEKSNTEFRLGWNSSRSLTFQNLNLLRHRSVRAWARAVTGSGATACHVSHGPIAPLYDTPGHATTRFAASVWPRHGSKCLFSLSVLSLLFRRLDFGL